MIEMKTENIFSLGTQVVANTTNCVGAMGKGVALAFKNRYPRYYEYYRHHCQHGHYAPGDLMVYAIPESDRINNESAIVSLFTKDHFKYNSKMAWVDRSVSLLNEWCSEYFVESVAMTIPGCGNGHLPRDDVVRLLHRHLDASSTTFYVTELKNT